MRPIFCIKYPMNAGVLLITLFKIYFNCKLVLYNITIVDNFFIFFIKFMQYEVCALKECLL